MRKILLPLAVIVLATALALGAAEALLRLTGLPVLPPSGWKWAQSPYRTQTDTATNELGLRGRPIVHGPDDFVVLLVGDSQVEAGTTPADRMPERILEQVLQQEFGLARARVFTVASAGWGTDQEHLALQQYLARYRADLVLLWFTAVNDFWENGFPDRSVQHTAGHLKPTFELGSRGEPVAHDVLPRTRVGYLADLARARAAGLDFPAWRLGRWLDGLPPGRPGGDRDGPACPESTVEEARMWEVVPTRPVTILSDEDIENYRSHFSPFGARRSPREQYQVDITRALLQSTAELATSHGAGFRFFYPYRPDLDAVLGQIRCVRSTRTGAVLHIDATDLVRDLDTPALRPFRLSFRLPPEPGLALGPGDIHHSEKGNLMVMRQLASQLAQQGLLPRTVTPKTPTPATAASAALR